VTTGIGPVLKWAGGKRRSAAWIVDRILLAGGRPSAGYAEPFAGGLAVLCEIYNRGLTTGPVVIGDVNPRLITFYRALAEDPLALIRAADDLPLDPTAGNYVAIRDRMNSLPPDDPEVAPLFVWVNRHGFNGLYRENARGACNTPWNKGLSWWVPAESLSAFYAFGNALTGARLLDRPYWDGLPVDTIYCDPPYCGGFTGYSGRWTADDQRALGEWARRMSAAHGSLIAISDRDSPATRAAYQGAQIDVTPVRHGIGAAASSRRTVEEILAIFGGTHGR